MLVHDRAGKPDVPGKVDTADGAGRAEAADAAGRAGAGRSASDIDQIRMSLQVRYDELTSEYDEAVLQNEVLRLVEVGDTAGDDQADHGTKTAERDTAQSLLRAILDRRAQYEHALARLAEGTYGFCETCATPIPVERLEIFPSATSCVACKQNRERRAA